MMQNVSTAKPAPEAVETQSVPANQGISEPAPLHLAEVTSDVMIERGWSLADLVDHMGPCPAMETPLSYLLAWKLFLDVRVLEIRPSPYMFRSLARALGVSERYLVQLDGQWCAYVRKTALERSAAKSAQSSDSAPETKETSQRKPEVAPGWRTLHHIFTRS